MSGEPSKVPRRRLNTLLGAILLIAGFSAGLFVRGIQADPSDSAVTHAAAAQLPISVARQPSDSESSVDQARLTRLEHQLEDIQASLARAKGQQTDDKTTVQRAEAPSFEESKKRVFTWWEGQLANVAREPRDASWAHERERQIQDAIPLMKVDAVLLRTTCKTSRCSVELEFKNFKSAQAQYEKIIHSSLNGDCARDIRLPDPERKDDKYVATVIYECARPELLSAKP